LVDLTKLLNSQSVSTTELSKNIGIGKSQALLVVNKLINENKISGRITKDGRFVPETERMKVLRRAEKDKTIEKLTHMLSEGTISETAYKTAIKSLEEKEINAQELPLGNHEVAVPTVSSVSNIWYLVPFFFGVIGGLIAWIANRYEDRKKADNLLIFGIIWSIIIYLVYYMLLTSMFSWY
jgi:hypothetical protein